MKKKRRNPNWGMKSPINERGKRFHGYLSHTRLPAYLDGKKTFLDCYIHESNNHTSIYLTESGANELAKAYCVNSKTTMVWDESVGGYWSNARRAGAAVINDQRQFIPYKPYCYKVMEDDGSMAVRKLFCVTQIVIALGILAKGVNVGEN